jgi:hypothetical protein
MTDKASRRGSNPDEPGMGPDLARFFQDWTELWREELQAQAKDPEAVPLAMLAGMTKVGMTSEIAAAMEMWRAAMVGWANTMGVRPSSVAASREPSASPRASAAAAPSDARDAEIERLARRVDELEARLAELEKPRRRRG